MAPSRTGLSNSSPEPGLLRQGIESLLLLALAVILFRGFGVEGYLISTGSMAPTLLGYHRRIHCPRCQELFARGTVWPGAESEWDSRDLDAAAFDGDSLPTHCPNCGYDSIPGESVPRNEGDQLLVHKHAYDFRDPRRWEVIVFRNPRDSRQAYVKRVVGLPGEQIEIIDGDVYANGTLCRKPYTVQRAIRIPVFQQQHEPADDEPDWQPRWHALQASGGWTAPASGELQYLAASSATPDQFEWMEYRHWVRSGGTHKTEVSLEGLAPPHPIFRLDDPQLSCEDSRLVCRGVLSRPVLERCLAMDDSPQFQRLMHQLHEDSHVVPLTDDYGYNSDGERPSFVHDLMLSCRLTTSDGRGSAALQLSDGDRLFRVLIDFPTGKVTLTSPETDEPIGQGHIDPDSLKRGVNIDLSLFDGQVVVAADEQLVLPIWEYVPGDRVPLRTPARIGVSGGDCLIDELVLYRDVHYTSLHSADSQVAQLSESEFFVLGDNSPVSLDSRVWDSPGVPRDALIGKPLVVHLPSRQGVMTWGGREHVIRVPDISRMRLIR